MTSFSRDDASLTGGTTELLADQILVTHCQKEDSVLGRGGFSVRAASTSDPTLLNWATRQLDQYELPVDMQRGSVEISQTPRRLALVPAPGNRTALVHSAYLSGDSCNPPRPHSFITHALVYSSLDTATAAQAWKSSAWQTSEIEPSLPKLLEAVRSVPRGSIVSDQAVTCFLSGADLESRRRTLRATLHGFLRTFETGSARNRLCILADPETVALLVHAISRLLPSVLAEAFWFSTYEPPQTSLRENRISRLVGSYTMHSLGRSETEALRRDAYLVDLLQTPPESSPELVRRASDWPLEEMLDLAAAGDWPAVREIRDLWAAQSPPPTLVGLSQALGFRSTVKSLRSDSMTSGDLIAADADEGLEALLEELGTRRERQSSREPQRLRRDPRDKAEGTKTAALKASQASPCSRPGLDNGTASSETEILDLTRERILFFLLGMLATLAGFLFLAIATGRLLPPPRQAPPPSSREDLSPIAAESSGNGADEDRRAAGQERAALREALGQAQDQYQQAEIVIAALRKKLTRLENRGHETLPGTGQNSVPVKSKFADIPLDISEKIELPGGHIASDCLDFTFYRPDRTRPSDLVLVRDSERKARGSLVGGIAIYAFEIKDGQVSWTHQGKEESLKAIQAITSGHEQDVIGYTTDTRFGLVRPGDWRAELKGRKVSQFALPRDPPSHRTFSGLNPGSPNLEDVLAVKGQVHVAIAKHKDSAAEGKDQAKPRPGEGREIDLIECWDSSTRSLRMTFDVSKHLELSKDGRNSRVRGMAFSPTRDRLVACFEDQELLVVLNPSQPEQAGARELMLRHSNAVRCFDFSADGVWLVSVDTNSTLTCWQVSKDSIESKHRVLGDSSSETTCLAMSRDKPGLLATGDRSGKVTIWRFPLTANESDPPRKLRELEHVGEVVKLEFSADGRVLAGLAATRGSDGPPSDSARPRPTGVIRIWPCAWLSAP